MIVLRPRLRHPYEAMHLGIPAGCGLVSGESEYLKIPVKARSRLVLRRLVSSPVSAGGQSQDRRRLGRNGPLRPDNCCVPFIHFS